MNHKAPILSFTSRYQGLSNVLINKALIDKHIDPKENNSPFVKLEDHNPIEFDVLWDTGATNSAITQEVVDRCGLNVVGFTPIGTVGGIQNVPVYLISIWLPNNIIFESVRVALGQFLPPAKVIIGMDVINKGDFAITHKDGRTTFSFRIPSVEEIDFTQTNPTPAIAQSDKIGRNSPCPCGSGKKYKRCCGGPKARA